QPGEDQALFEAVRTIGMELCPALDIAIPVGKDSLSMRTTWQDEDGTEKAVTSPMTCIVTAFAPVLDVTLHVTPELQKVNEESVLVRVDLSRGKFRLGASVLTLVYNHLGEVTADLDDVSDLKAFFNVIQDWTKQGKLLAYHDISDGGLLATVAEMMFASRLGVDLTLGQTPVAALVAELFAEEVGCVVQVRLSDWTELQAELADSQLANAVSVIGTINDSDTLTVAGLSLPRVDLQTAWAKASHQIQRLRDNSDCADQEFALISDNSHQGLIAKPTFDLNEPIEAPFLNLSQPKMAILREQGVNGHIEMAAAFDRVGFSTYDVHMSDLLAGRVRLDDFQGLVACGGFSYGDVLGAGGGWAKSVLYHAKLRDQFESFFHRSETFTLGVCNGCQMLSQLNTLIPGAEL
ncbi:MAG TPA: phosphoribosylformylglycinamidine synthase subunit PurQ, partial [Aquirhabdus sp.]